MRQSICKHCFKAYALCAVHTKADFLPQDPCIDSNTKFCCTFSYGSTHLFSAMPLAQALYLGVKLQKKKKKKKTGI